MFSISKGQMLWSSEKILIHFTRSSGWLNAMALDPKTIESRATSSFKKYFCALLKSFLSTV